MKLLSVYPAIRRSVLALGLLSGFIGNATAQSLPAVGHETDGWRHTLGLYLFTPLRTEGVSTVAGSSVDIDLNLSEVLELLDFAASGRYEAWNDDFGVIVDANYVGIEGDGDFPAPPGSTFSVNVRQKWLALMGAYRVMQGTYGAQNRAFAVDLQAGARLNALRQEIAVTTPGPVARPVIGGDESWVEPVIGARGMWRLNDRWTTVASLELGGFGAGGNKLQVGANVGFDYQAWDNTAITFGYRYFGIDYSKELASGTFAYDVTQHGPYLGVKVMFK